MRHQFPQLLILAPVRLIDNHEKGVLDFTELCEPVSGLPIVIMWYRYK